LNIRWLKIVKLLSAGDIICIVRIKLSLCPLSIINEDSKKFQPKSTLLVFGKELHMANKEQGKNKEKKKKKQEKPKPPKK